MADDQPEHTKRPLTARQLAAMIGVSQSAVSRAFTPGKSISPDLRERILRSAQEFGYQPNAIASMLTTRRTNIVGIVVADVHDTFYAALIESLTQRLQKVGLQSLLFNVSQESSIEEQLVAIRTYNVDAVVVVAATLLTEKELAWATQGRKAILLNRLSDGDITTICCDNTAGVRAVVDHFNDLGCKRIGYVSRGKRTAITMERQTAFLTRIAELGLRLAGTVETEAFTYRCGWHGALKLVPEHPDAIFFTSDTLAFGGIDALRLEAGLRVPEDIAVAGMGDVRMAAWPSYALTTYTQPISEIVTKTIERLTAVDDLPHTHISIPGELIVRASTDPSKKRTL